jgi:hypothetical protein
MNISRAVGEPSPKTVWVRVAARMVHLGHVETTFAISRSLAGRSAAGMGGPSNPASPNRVAGVGAEVGAGLGLAAGFEVDRDAGVRFMVAGSG